MFLSLFKAAPYDSVKFSALGTRRRLSCSCRPEAEASAGETDVGLRRLDDALAQLERTVVLESAEVTAFERSWYAPLKLERFPDQVRPLGSFIPARQSLF